MTFVPYRASDFLAASFEYHNDHFARAGQAVLVADVRGTDAYITRDSVLAFHDLALVNPRRISVGTTRRVRRSLADHIEVIRDDLPAPTARSTTGCHRRRSSERWSIASARR